ncbi:hypothetical protein HYN48_02750 [Flavobacterium magnum]|uniref:Lipocalin-like domain-containing protein n=1 Tax=Flavobacterium magnum TaxID=2162713 RepID=A0A2S0RCS9_9FLAO|nr:lipocalin family protein [Flavobacterium magnum]AWA29090.1 hypothetical protein HYN48_02750 [Flavobacterium magnum]
MNKKIISLTAILLCILSISFVSCESDDEGGDYVSPNYVAATWKLTAVGALNTQSTLIYTPVMEGSCDAQTVSFTEDFNFTRNYSVLVDEACTPKTTTGTYALEQGNIVVTFVPEGQTLSESISYDIITLSDVLLEVAYTDKLTGKLVFLKFAKQIMTAN